MSNLPRVDLTILDGGLGQGLPLSGKNVAVIGVSSESTTADGVVRAYSNKAQIVAQRGFGPGVEAAAKYVDQGALVYFVGLAITTPSTASAVTPGAENTSATVMTVTGDPLDKYNVVVTVTRAGTVGSDPEPGFSYSMDGGRIESAEIRVPSAGTYEIPDTGITLNFTAATMVVGDTFSFDTTEPLAASGDVTDAFDALQANPNKWRFVHVVGPSDATLAESIADKLATMEGANRYTAALLETRDFDGDTHDEWADAVTADFDAFVSPRVAVAAGHCRFPSALTSRQLLKSVAFPAGARAIKVEEHVDLGRFKDGPLLGVDPESLTHDERVTEVLESERFLTLKTDLDEPGAFVANPRLMASPGSDFKYLQSRFVMDLACATAQVTLKKEVNDSVRVVPNPDLGYSVILEQDRQAIKAACEDALRNALIAPGHASLARVTIASDDDILTTETVTVTIEVIPVGYKKRILTTIGFRKSFSA